MSTRYYTVARHTFAVTLPEGETGIALPSYEPFVEATANERQRLFVLEVDDTFYPEQRGDTIGEFECGGADFGVYLLDDGQYQILISPPGGQYCGLLQVSKDFSKAVLATRGETGARSFAVNNALMLMYAFAAADKDTLLVHASVIKQNGYGYLFLGPSGTGKSTHSSLWLKYIGGSELLNDDNPVVRVWNDEVVVYGSPWSGKTPCYRNEEARVGAFVRIKQEKDNSIVRDSTLQAFSILLPSVSTMKWDKRVYTGICDALSRVIALTRQYTLGCRPDRAAAEICHKEVAQHLISHLPDDGK